MSVTSPKVLLLKGGVSAERAVSLATAAACAKALTDLGHDFQELDFSGDAADLVSALGQGVDVMLNCLHGTFGEDGRVQAVADLMGVPYTHSGVCASALAMHKARSIDVFRAHDLPTAKNVVVKAEDLIGMRDWPLPLPLVVKPVAEGSSVGVHVITDRQNFSAYHATFTTLAASADLMFEEYIAGRELTVAVAEDGAELVALGVTELQVDGGFYDYRAKYSTQSGATHFCPAQIPEQLEAQLKNIALAAHRVLGLRGVSRSDFRYDPGQQRLVILETNTQPGMTETSLLPEQADLYGWDFPTLVQKILQAARHD